MDFDKLFAGIGLADIGIKSFYELHMRSSDNAFAESFTRACEVFDGGDIPFGEYIAEFAERENVPVEVLNLYIYMRMCERSVAIYEEKGIDIEIFYATMKEVVERCWLNFDETGIYGIPQEIYRRWFRRYIGCTIFRLGRLNFDIAKSIYDTEIEGIKVCKDDPCISVHIPGGSRLDEDECEAAYDQARWFFKKYFNMNPPVFFCYSWLIQPWLAEVLPEQSLISRFQGRYKIIDFVDDPGDVLRWVFPERCENPKDYPENTTIQRAVKERILRGDIIGYGSGVRL